MRFFILLLFVVLESCTSQSNEDKIPTPAPEVSAPLPTPNTLDTLSVDKPKVYGNARFKNVTAKKMAGNTYKVTGEGQIFEASFNWVVEDGHNELKSGYTTTDAGAPAWGKFNFDISVRKERENSVLHLILYEASAQDGRRTHELPILLE